MPATQIKNLATYDHVQRVNSKVGICPIIPSDSLKCHWLRCNQLIKSLMQHLRLDLLICLFPRTRLTNLLANQGLINKNYINKSWFSRTWGSFQEKKNEYSLLLFFENSRPISYFTLVPYYTHLNITYSFKGAKLHFSSTPLYCKYHKTFERLQQSFLNIIKVA